MRLDTLKDHEMPRYGYSTRQSGPPPRDHITEYRLSICRGNAMGNTNLWRFFMPCRGHAKLYENGWEIPLFFACGRRYRGANPPKRTLFKTEERRYPTWRYSALRKSASGYSLAVLATVTLPSFSPLLILQFGGLKIAKR